MRRNLTDLAYNPTALIREELDINSLASSGIDRKLVRVGQIVPQDGMIGGWLYLSSEDCAVEWEITTSQDRCQVQTYRKTGPASWSRVWLSSGCQINAQLYFVSPLGIKQDTGLVYPEPQDSKPKIKWWFYPYSVNEAFETMDFSFGPNGFDDFPQIPGSTTVRLGYPPRTTRFLYLQTTGRFGVTLGRVFGAYANVLADNQAGFAVSPWTSVSVSNQGNDPISLLGTWSNVPGSILNP